MHARIIPVQAAGLAPVEHQPSEPDPLWTESLIQMMCNALASGQDRLVLTLHIHPMSERQAVSSSHFIPGMTAAQFCKGLNGVNIMQLGHFLKRRRWLYNESASGVRWRVASYARDRYMVEQRTHIAPRDQIPFIAHTPVLLPKGAMRLYDLYRRGKLPMKKSWDGCLTVLDLDNAGRNA